MMKRLYILLSLLVPLLAGAQTYSIESLYGKQANRYNILYNLGVPNDTIAPPAAYTTYPHIAAKDSILYVWSPSGQRWRATASGAAAGGGGGSYTFLAPLSNNSGVVSITSVPWSLITSRPTTLSGYGITDALPVSDTAAMLDAYVRKGTTGTGADTLRFAQGLVQSGKTVYATYGAPMWNANRIQGYLVKPGQPDNGAFLRYSASEGMWIPDTGTIAGGGVGVETDPTVAAHIKAITSANVANWNTAYNKTPAAITFSGSNSKTLTLTLNDGTVLQGSFTDLSGTGSGGITEEVDPTVASHIKAITTTHISNWNTAFTWGNHAGLYSPLGHVHNASTDITSGTLPIARGGTGLSAIGTVGQSLRVNAAGTGLEYYTPSAGGGGTTYSAAAPLYINSTTIGVDTTSLPEGLATKGRLYKVVDSLKQVLGYTFSNGLTSASGAVKWGGTLTGNTTLSGANTYGVVFDNLGTDGLTIEALGAGTYSYLETKGGAGNWFVTDGHASGITMQAGAGREVRLYSNASGGTASLTVDGAASKVQVSGKPFFNNVAAATGTGETGLVIDNTTGEVRKGGTGGGSATIDALSDVSTTPSTSGVTLQYDSDSAKWLKRPVATLDLTAPAAWDKLRYNGTDWVNYRTGYTPASGKLKMVVKDTTTGAEYHTDLATGSGGVDSIQEVSDLTIAPAGNVVLYDGGMWYRSTVNKLKWYKAEVSDSITFSAGGPANTLDLDALGLTPARAYSLRKLRAGYSGPAVRVLRSSDNTEQDIGFDADGHFDAAAFSAFVGAGIGYIVSWYDQSGNGQHSTQTLTANRPRITLSTLNGRVGITFQSSIATFLEYPAAWLGTGARTVIAAWQNTNASFTSMENQIAGETKGGSPGTGSWFQLQSRTHVVTGHPYLAGYGADLTDGTVPNTVGILASAHYDGTMAYLRRNGSQVASGALTINTTGCSGLIGASKFLAANSEDFCDAHITEVLIFTSNVTGAALTSYETNTKTYYGL